MVAETRRHLFTVDEYFRMAETGILDKNDRVELIEGEIVEMPPIGSHHAGIVNRLVTLFKELIGTEVILAPQNPIRLGRSAPQPGIALLRLRNDDYTESHPEPSDILLLVEIADSSILSDQRRKVPFTLKLASLSSGLSTLRTALLRCIDSLRRRAFFPASLHVAVM